MTHRGKLGRYARNPPVLKINVEASIPARSPIGSARLPRLLCRAPDKLIDNNHSPGISHIDLESSHQQLKKHKKPSSLGVQRHKCNKVAAVSVFLGG